MTGLGTLSWGVTGFGSRELILAPPGAGVSVPEKHTPRERKGGYFAAFTLKVAWEEEDQEGEPGLAFALRPWHRFPSVLPHFDAWTIHIPAMGWDQPQPACATGETEAR